MAQKIPYGDLEIRILKLEEQGYPVEITLNHERQFKRGYLAPRPEAENWETILDSVTAGQELFDWFLADASLTETWGQVREQRPHRIRLRIDRDAAELHALPWELLQEPGEGDLSHNIAQNSETPFSRYLAGTWQPGNPILKRPLKMLVAVANPDNLEADYGLSPLDVDGEWSLIQAAIEGAAVTCDLLPQPCTLSALEDRLKEGYHILHFIGHGSFSQKKGEAALYMADEANQVALVKDRDLATMLASQLASSDTQSEDKLRLVFLASCQSASRSPADAFRGVAPQLVDAGVPAVLAMQDLVPVETARAFTGTFYQQLLEHGLVDRASNEARANVQTEQKSGPAIPVLFMRLREGQLLGQRGRVVSQDEEGFWPFLLENINLGRCIPILGPRVNANLLPDAATVAEKLAEKYNYPLADRHNLQRVAQFMALRDPHLLRLDYMSLMQAGIFRYLGLKPTKEDRQHYKDATFSELVEGLNWAEHILILQENQIHHRLADFRLPLYLTTNFDNFMLAALQHKGLTAARQAGPRWTESQAGALEYTLKPPPTLEQPVVFHLNGYDNDPEQLKHLVLSEEDYLAHLVRLHRDWKDVLPMDVIAALTEYPLLFLGYTLDDWEFRVILQGLLKSITRNARLSVGVQLEVEDNPNTEQVIDYFRRYLGQFDIEIYWGGPQQFINELHTRWQAERAVSLSADNDTPEEEGEQYDDDWF